MSEFYFCVDNKYPEMKPGARYNSAVIPSIGGTQVYDLHHIFEDMSYNDSYYVRVKLPDDAVITRSGLDKIFTDSYIYICRVPFSDEAIKSLLNDDAILDLGYKGSSLIWWCINNKKVDLLQYILKRYDCAKPILFDSINSLISEDIFTDLIKTMIDMGYDIHQNGDLLMLFAASHKNLSLCNYLLDRGAYIPKQVYNMYSANPDKYPEMNNLINKFSYMIIE